jgi:hypothetical protein
VNQVGDPNSKTRFWIGLVPWMDLELTWRIERLPRGYWNEKKMLACVALVGTAGGAWNCRWWQIFHRSVDLCLASMILELFFQIGER